MNKRQKKKQQKKINKINEAIIARMYMGRGLYNPFPNPIQSDQLSH